MSGSAPRCAGLRTPSAAGEDLDRGAPADRLARGARRRLRRSRRGLQARDGTDAGCAAPARPGARAAAGRLSRRSPQPARADPAQHAVEQFRDGPGSPVTAFATCGVDELAATLRPPAILARRLSSPRANGERQRGVRNVRANSRQGSRNRRWHDCWRDGFGGCRSSRSCC